MSGGIRRKACNPPKCRENEKVGSSWSFIQLIKQNDLVDYVLCGVFHPTETAGDPFDQETDEEVIH